MGKAAQLVFGLVFLIVACSTGSEEGPSGSTTIPGPVTTSSTIEPPATTTSAAPVPAVDPDQCTLIGARPVLLESAREYCTGSPVLPITIRVDSGRWLVRSGAESAIVATLDSDEDGSSDATIAFLSVQPEVEVGQLLDSMVGSEEGLVALTEPDRFSAGRHSGLTLTVEAEPQPLPFEPEGCTSSGTPNFAIDEPGYPVLNTGGFSPRTDYGFPSCFRSRLWILDVDGVTVTVIASANPDDRFEDVMPMVESFLMNNVMFGDADG